jgi:hypothetical protein
MAKGIFDDVINVILPELIEAVYNVTGEAAVEALKDGCSKDDGRLSDSLSYAWFAKQSKEARVGNKAVAGDGAPTPSAPFTMYIGTRVPYAWYVEKGTHKHKTGNDSEGFVDRVTEWAKRHGFSEKEIPALIRSIHDKGTIEHPFFFEKEEVVRRLLSMALVKALKKLPSEVTRTAPIKIDFNITSTNK